MAKSLPDRPSKPYPDFPLTAHPNGQWCKKINGTIRYFGEWANPNAARDKYLAERDDLYANRLPSRLSGEGATTTKTVVNSFLEQCKARVKANDLAAITYRDYQFVGKLILEHLGRETDPTKLGPNDFARFWNAVAPGCSPSRMTKVVNVTRMIFKWAGPDPGRELIASLPKYGPDFKIPSAKAKRVQRAARGKKLLTSSEAKALVSIPDPMWRAICLLGLNGGLGNTDIAGLLIPEVNGDWLSKSRAKTGVDRRIPLWPETVAALADWMKVRRAPRAGCEDLVFLSKTGREMIRILPSGDRTDLIDDGFRRSLKAAGVTRKGVGFYWLRHTFQTIGDGARDKLATSAIMGHVDSSIAGGYREELPEDERLLAVTDHVRKWVGLPG